MKKTGILATIIIGLTAISATAAGAAEWNFYGSARLSTYLTDVDNPLSPDTKSYSQELNPDSRIGARVKVNDELSGRFEYGAGVNVRLLYGAWDFGPGELLVGQGYSPFNLFYSNQIYTDDNNMLNYGGVYSGRNPMLQLSFGNFKIAALAPGTGSVLVDGVEISDTEATLPRIEASYQFNFDRISLDIAGGFNTYEVVSGNDSFDIDSYMLAVGGDVKLGKRFYLAGNVWVGQNTGPYGLYNAPEDDPVIAGSSVYDNEAYGALLVAGMKLNETFSVEAGYGYTQAELDTAGSVKDDLVAYYVQSTVTLAPGVFFVPEIGVIDNQQDSTGSPESETRYYGVKWQINF